MIRLVALLERWHARRVRRWLERRRTGEVMDLREPGEAFCSACPDHEACAMGYPCSLVQRVDAEWRLGR